MINSSLISKNINKLLNNKMSLSIILLVLAFAETGAMALFKSPSTGIVVIGFVCYMAVTMGLVYLVRHYGLATGHALFDVSSIIIATMVGLFVLGESASPKKIAGLVLAIVSVYLLQ